MQETFDGLGIAPRILETLARLRFSSPTPIQAKAIPVGIEGKDVVGIAQTGTGKTLAFGIPMLQQLASKKGRGLVLVPTRELAMQVDVMLQQIGRPVGLRTAVLIGGASMVNQIAAIRRNPHIIVATPGRLLDHLQQKTVSLKDVRVLVLDEADRMLDMGFAPQIERILAAAPKPEERQTLLFSATMPATIVSIARKHMRMPLRVEVAPSGTAAEKVDQEIFVVTKADKPRMLEKILAETRGPVLVFMRTKHTAKKLTRLVQHMGYAAAEIHSNRSLAQRKAALDAFKNGAVRVLVATDIAARGIDVKGIAMVVNFDLPTSPEDYVHRIGRTGRAGEGGRAVSFMMPDQRRDLQDIERLIRKSLPLKQVSGLPPQRAVPSMPRQVQRHRQRVDGERRYHRAAPPHRKSSRGRRSSHRTGGTRTYRPVSLP